MQRITEPARQIPVCEKVDVCVVGGGCTGVFAAVRAARLGLRTALVEKHNCFGGTAAAGLVNVWHSLHDTAGNDQIIAGLTAEVLERLKQEDALRLGDQPHHAYTFQPAKLKLVLDRLVTEHQITAYLHTWYAGVACDGRRLTHVFIENKDGRSAVEAGFVIDASGDGDIARDLHLPSFTFDFPQPASSCFLLQGDLAGVDLWRLLQEHGAEFGMEDDWGWSNEVPGLKNITMRADHHVKGLLSRAGELTAAEIRGRGQAGALEALLRKYVSGDIAIVDTCAQIGIRDTVHYRTRFQADERNLLNGTRYPDAVLNGTYRVDIHHGEDNGITLKYLDGRIEQQFGRGTGMREGRWDTDGRSSGAMYYQVPFDLLVQEGYENFIPVGRMLNGDKGAYGALRVMVNLNQLGEAAGAAAYLAASRGTAVQELDGREVRSALRAGGSAL